jgi:tetratricopeptide (TPR) repeat protein
VRGEALVAAHRYAEAVAEFQKILDHRCIVGVDPIGALAHWQLGKAFAFSGDKAKAKAAYNAFLALWKNADLDVSILKALKQRTKGCSDCAVTFGSQFLMLTVELL